MNYYAHSPKNGVEAQMYAAHIRNVCTLAERYAKEAGAFCKNDRTILQRLTAMAAEYHDLGKLDVKNQKILSGGADAKVLPINHVDAGAAYWLNENHFSAFAAAVIQAHHRGFPDFAAESCKENYIFRDAGIAAEVDKQLPLFEAIHKKLLNAKQFSAAEENIRGDKPVFLRMLLSCLADADHTDTARHYSKYPKTEQVMPLYAGERLARLDAHISELQQSCEKSERNRLRNEMYRTCRDAEINADICSCDSPVGSGKTTAVMANMLKQAQRRGLRRVFVVLPFTNIIRQSVQTYRDILTLPGENPNDVVAELHHLTDFETIEARHLTALWRAPIIVTTAVAFFETLASDSPAALRRLHELPGSAIFIDESHAALPVSLLPLAWRWINVLANEWGCYWVLGSGSLSRFWTIPEIAGKTAARAVPEIVESGIRKSLSYYERNRISYRYNPVPFSSEALAECITSFPGSRLVILNTVQSAAVLADLFRQKYGRSRVEHLSTALTPNDRAMTLDRVKSRLKNESDGDWTLIATSCVEAGMDFSFRTGFRELASLASLLQAAGRVNRNGKIKNGEVWTFRIAEGGMLKLNPKLKQAGEILKSYFEDAVPIEPQLTTQAVSEEIRLYGLEGKHKKLLQNEENRNFRSVEADFKVIDSDTALAVTDEAAAKRLLRGEIDRRELQKCSVQIAKYKLNELKIPCISENIYCWNQKYDSFLGYMAGIIDFGLK